MQFLCVGFNVVELAPTRTSVIRTHFGNFHGQTKISPVSISLHTLIDSTSSKPEMSQNVTKSVPVVTNVRIYEHTIISKTMQDITIRLYYVSLGSECANTCNLHCRTHNPSRCGKIRVNLLMCMTIDNIQSTDLFK